MDTKKRFSTYEELELHGVKLRVRSETQQVRFENHLRALGDKDVRSTLLKGAMKDAIHDFKPARAMAELMTGGGIASQVVMGMLTHRGGLMRRLLTSVAAIVAPNLLAKLATRFTGRANGEVEHSQNGHAAS